MDFISATEIKKEISPEDIVLGRELSFGCCVHKIKKRSTFTFVTLRTGKYTFLTVHNPKFCDKPLKGVFEGVYLYVTCKIREEKKAENGLEIAITDYNILSKPMEKYPLAVSDRIIDCSLEEMLENRSVTYRNPIEKAPAFVFSSVIDGFSDFMHKNGFINIKTPNITQIHPEEDKDMLSLNYFGKDAYLINDPGVYTLCSLAYFDRVFEVSTVFNGKKRNSPRLLNEYTALHFDMAYVTDIKELMSVGCSILCELISKISSECKYQLDLLGAELPVVGDVPVVTFIGAMEFLKKEDEQSDLDPTDEKRICKWAKEKYNSDFVFVAEYPTCKRPHYYKENKGFALLFRGMEIAFGGLSKNELNEYETSAYSEHFSDFFKYGMPPCGEVSIGAERFVMQLLGLHDIRQASMFPRDIRNITP